MLTAHLPSGYLLGKGIGQPSKRVLGAALIGAIFPDFDLLWYHFIDGHAVHHHHYWVHIPLFWFCVAPVGLALCWRSQWRMPVAVFFAAIFLHLALDTLSGSGVMWAAPASEHFYSLVKIEPNSFHWIFRRFMHWTFGAELLIWAAALFVYFKKPTLSGSASGELT